MSIFQSSLRSSSTVHVMGSLSTVNRRASSTPLELSLFCSKSKLCACDVYTCSNVGASFSLSIAESRWSL
jgi:hypothetical protein